MSMEEVLGELTNVIATMDGLAQAMPALRSALAQIDDAVLDVGPAAAAMAGIRDHESMEAEVTEAFSGRFEAARLRLLEALR